MRIATWNLERPRLGGVEKNALRMKVLREQKAELWVLTESSTAIRLDGYTVVATPSHPTCHTKGEHYASVLTTWPVIRSLETWDEYLSVCVEVESPVGPALVYGTIITYANDRGVNMKSKRWVEHRKAIKAQGVEWARLRQQFPKHLFVLAGDFNQSRDGSGWYEDAVSMALLSRHLEAAGLRCLTEENLNQKFKLRRSTVDHVCLGAEPRIKGWTVNAWPGTIDGRKLSDHNGVLVQVAA
jgi:hypothetical protein